MIHIKNFKTFESSENLSSEHIELLQDISNTSGYGILRKMMGSKEIKLANELTKMGYLDKGMSDEKRSSVAYFITSKGRTYLK